jgi:hypothetical protein
MLVTAPQLGCSAERYARPSGPAPRYELAPLAPWDAGAAPTEDPLAAALSDEPERPAPADAGSSHSGDDIRR